MDYLNLHTSVLDGEEFKTATLAQRGTWLSVYRYCAGQENAGRIAGAKGWSDRIWLQICGVTARELAVPCRLWKWEGDDLLLAFYNRETEANVQRLRSQAAAGAHARWHRPALPPIMPDGMPQGIPQGTGRGDAKGKVTEGKGKEDIPQGAAAAAPGQVNGQHQPINGRRKPKTGSTSPSEHPEQLGSRMITVGRMMRRQENTPWSAAELEAFRLARLDSCDGADFAAQVETMGAYYAAKIPREIDFRRRELKTLLNNWPGELDKARAYNRDNDDGVKIV